MKEDATNKNRILGCHSADNKMSRSGIFFISVVFGCVKSFQHFDQNESFCCEFFIDMCSVGVFAF